MHRVALLLATALSLGTSFAAEPIVSAKAGSIFINAGGVEKQLTSSGRDSAPAISPDRKWVVFVRSADGKPIPTGNNPDGEPRAELWQIAADGKEPTMLVRTRQSEEMKELIAGFENLQFSADGKLLYFETPAWMTSGALHVVDTRNRKEHFVCASNGFEVLHSGKYRDHLLVNQHRYFVGPGSYDWFWLFNADGKEVGPVGEETENFKSLYGEE